MPRKTILIIGFLLVYSTAFPQTTISFNVAQPDSSFQVDAGPDLLYDGNNQAFLGGDPSASGGFEEFIYEWDNESYLDDPSVPNPQVISLNSVTTFTLSVTDVIGNCTKYDEVIVDYVVSTKDFGAVELDAFPNPFLSKLTINSSDGIGQVVIYDVFGREVENLFLNSIDSYVLNTDNFASGIYLFQFHLNNKQTKTLKLCKSL